MSGRFVADLTTAFLALPKTPLASAIRQLSASLRVDVLPACGKFIRGRFVADLTTAFSALPKTPLASAIRQLSASLRVDVLPACGKFMRGRTLYGCFQRL